MTDPWMARQQAKEHHAQLVRQANRERRLASTGGTAGGRGFWARLFGLRRRAGAVGVSERPTAGSTAARSTAARLDVAKHDL